MSYRDTYESLCVLLEEYADADTETVADQILGMLGLLGEDLLATLDPPPGLQHWLVAHGLSLTAVVEGRSPRVWEAVQEEETEEDEVNDVEEEDPPPQVGDHVEYRTAPTGPQHRSEMGAGQVIEVGEDFVRVRPVGHSDIYLVPGLGDRVRTLR